MSDGMGREPTYLSSHATNRYFIPNWGKYWNTWNPYEGEKKYKHFDVGIRPAVYYETGHWRFGVQSHVGFLDIKRKFPDRPYASFFDNKYHAMSLVATVNYHW